MKHGLPIFRRTPAEILFGAAATSAQRVFALLVVTGAASVLAFASVDAARETGVVRDMEAKLDAARAVTVARPRPLSAPALAMVQRARLNSAIRHLNTPWGEVLDSLEAGTPESVLITSIESTGERSTVRLQVNGADIDTLLHYAESLAAMPAFVHVNLVQQESANGPGMARLTFELVLRNLQDPRQ